VLGLWAFARRAALPPIIKRYSHVLLAAVLAQATLGAATVLYIVPIPVAAAHQAGSLTLLGILTWVMHLLRRIR
jgi:cytochrome c oxidase assembly protein subunit 15